MSNWKFRLTAMMAMLAWLALPQGAHAQAASTQPIGDQGVISGKTFAKIPPGSAVSIEPEDNTDLNVRLQPVIANELKSRGYLVSEKAKVRFIYNADTPTTRRIKEGIWRSAERGQTNKFGRRRYNRDPSRQSGPMNDPIIRQGIDLSGQNIKGGRPIRHLVSVIVLHDNGTQYWVGTAVITNKRGDSFEITSALSKALVRGLGRDMEKQRFVVN